MRGGLDFCEGVEVCVFMGRQVCSGSGRTSKSWQLINDAQWRQLT
jgi:predicted Fe-S protein YdhL (DUF1289 family)